MPVVCEMSIPNACGLLKYYRHGVSFLMCNFCEFQFEYVAPEYSSLFLILGDSIRDECIVRLC